MAVVVSIARGHDASYPFKTIGAADSATVTGERGAGYYLSAVEKGGEPAGTWVGNGAAELGFCDGNTVRREDFEPLYGQFLDPRDPSGKTYLGSPPRVNAELAAIYQAKLAAHPGATAGHHTGPGVSEFFGDGITSYDWAYMIAPDRVVTLLTLLGGHTSDDVLDLLATYHHQRGGQVNDLLRRSEVAATFSNWHS